MSEKTYLYNWEKQDLDEFTDIEKEAFRRANELNDKLLDLKFIIEEMDYEWGEYIQFLEDEKISKICEFRGGQCIDFNEELLNSIVNTLRKSLNDAHKAVNYNSKKIALNRVVEK
jgi:hypothetical protein